MSYSIAHRPHIASHAIAWHLAVRARARGYVTARGCPCQTVGDRRRQSPTAEALGTEIDAGSLVPSSQQQHMFVQMVPKRVSRAYAPGAAVKHARAHVQRVDGGRGVASRLGLLGILQANQPPPIRPRPPQCVADRYSARRSGGGARGAPSCVSLSAAIPPEARTSRVPNPIEEFLAHLQASKQTKRRVTARFRNVCVHDATNAPTPLRIASTVPRVRLASARAMPVRAMPVRAMPVRAMPVRAMPVRAVARQSGVRTCAQLCWTALRRRGSRPRPLVE